MPGASSNSTSLVHGEVVRAVVLEYVAPGQPRKAYFRLDLLSFGPQIKQHRQW